MKPYLLFVSVCFLFSCSSSHPAIEGKFIYSIEKPIEGQIHTAKRLRKYMDEKQYEMAIGLFSLEHQEKINSIKDNEEVFGFWCDAWTFDDAKFDRYTALINNQEAPFVFEDGEWKIDEK